MKEEDLFENEKNLSSREDYSKQITKTKMKKNKILKKNIIIMKILRF